MTTTIISTAAERRERRIKEYNKMALYMARISHKPLFTSQNCCFANLKSRRFHTEVKL